MTADRPADESWSPRSPDAGSGAPSAGSGWPHAPPHYSPTDHGAHDPRRDERVRPNDPRAVWSGPWAPDPQQQPGGTDAHAADADDRSHPSDPFGILTNGPPKRRAGLIVAAALLVVALVGGGAALVTKNRTFFTQQDLITRDDTVTLVVPTDWWDETSSEAGHSEGTGEDFSVTPDVEASSPDETMYVAVWVDRRPEDSGALEEAQKDFVDTTCQKDACTSQSKVASLTIDGHQAVQQTIRLKPTGSYPAATAILTSILSQHRLVSVYAEGDDDTAVEELAAVTAKVRVRD